MWWKLLRDVQMARCKQMDIKQEYLYSILINMGPLSQNFAVVKFRWTRLQCELQKLAAKRVCKI